MKCIVCKHGHTKPGRMTSTLERGEATIVVKDVPAEICDNCGEAYLSEAVSVQLLEQAEAGIAAGVEFDVRRYQTAA